MSLDFKINTAILICSAFLFRLLFVNISIASSFNARQSSVIKNHVEHICDRGKMVKGNTNAGTREYSSIEICEENPDDENNLSKVNSLVLVRILYSFFSNKTVSESNILFDFADYRPSSKKYLAISVLRI